jgi:site-specific DNA-methyltransferase (adenine-specific)
VPKNPRIIRDQKYRLLKKSIEEDPEMLGLREILLYPYNGKLIIIGGNMRYQALRELGYTSAIVKILPAAWSAEKLKAIVIKDNSGFGEWDWDALASEWEPAQLVDWGLDVPDIDKLKDEEEAQEDDYNPSDDLEGKAKSRPGDVYALGKHRLICGDSTDAALIDALCGDTKVDCIITDPPYNVDYSSKNETLNAWEARNPGKKKANRIQKDIANDKMGDTQFRLFLSKAFGAADRHLKPGGVFYVWHAGSEGYNFISAVREVGWELKQVLIWNKNNMVLGRQDYQWKHEPCLYGWKPGAGHYFIDSRSQLTVYQNEDGTIDYASKTKAELLEILKIIGQLPTDIIDEDKPLRSADHPTMKPIKLMARCVKNSTRSGEVVLDPFGGSGSTLMACHQLGRVCYTVELDPHYVDVIVKRWEEYTQEEAQYLGNIDDNGKTT